MFVAPRAADPAAPAAPVKRYDRSYFDKWYRDPRHRVSTAAGLARKVAMVVGVAEYLLGRPLRRALDVGAGEGSWRGALRRLRPRLDYVGVDPSAYAVRRAAPGPTARPLLFLPWTSSPGSSSASSPACSPRS